MQANSPSRRDFLHAGATLAVASRIKKHQRLETPDLDVQYQPPKDSGFLRGDYTSPVVP